MLIYFYIDYNLVISNVFIFDTMFLIAIYRQIVLDRKKLRKEGVQYLSKDICLVKIR